jgi:DNA-binding PadR family transcriptional regulator
MDTQYAYCVSMTVRGALLQLLDEGETYGYQLKQEFEERTGGIWPLNIGQVYSTLDRLVRDGAVAESGDGEAQQRRYRITESGRAELAEWLAGSPVESGPARDELIMKVLLAVARGGATAIDVVDDQRAAILTALRRERAALRESGGVGPAERLAREAVMARMEADATWLERCEDHLRAEARRGNGR